MEYGSKMQSEAIANYLRLTRRVGITIPPLNADEQAKSGPDAPGTWTQMISGQRVDEVSRIVIDEAHRQPPRYTSYERYLRFRPLQRRRLPNMQYYDSLVSEARQDTATVQLPGSGRVLNVRQPSRDQLKALIDDYNASPYLSASPAGMVLEPGGNRDESLLAIHCRYMPHRMEEDSARNEITPPGLKEVFPNINQLMQAVIQLIIFLPENPKGIDIVLWQHHWIHCWRLVRDARVDTLLAEFLEVLAEPILQWGQAKALASDRSLPELRIDIKQAIETKLNAILRHGLKAKTWDPVGQRFVWQTLDKYVSATVPSGTQQLQATMFRNIYSTRMDTGGAVWQTTQPGQRRPAAYGFRVHKRGSGVLEPRYRAVLPQEESMDLPHTAFAPGFD
jgi:hypothetical protein